MKDIQRIDETLKTSLKRNGNQLLLTTLLSTVTEEKVEGSPVFDLENANGTEGQQGNTIKKTQ